MVEVGCPLCGGRPRAGEAPAIAESGHTAFRCVGCGLIYVTPRPEPSQVLAIYEHDASQTAARVHVAKARDPYAVARARHVLDLLRPHVLAQGPACTVLEVGAGGGVLLAEAQTRGYDVSAIEPNAVLATFLRVRGVACEEAPLSSTSFGGRPFDVIVHVNVLSHFDDPVAALRLMAERLAPGGIMVIETGNFADVDPRYHGLIAATERFQLPEHLTFFGEASLGRLLTMVDLDLVALHRYSRIPEKRGPAVLRALGLGRLTNRLRFWLTYRLGAWFPRRGRPQTLILVARRTEPKRQIAG